MLTVKNNKKLFRSAAYNYIFDQQSGHFARWGATFADDPQYSPSPEILDIEITSICAGIGNEGVCKFCYKSNTPRGRNMTIETFKAVLDKFPPTLTQLAFGADGKAEANPELWKMAEYTRAIGVIPNITVADITEDVAKKLTDVMGGVAVSRYSNKDYCYNSVQKLVQAGCKQVKIHLMVSKETLNQAYETIQDWYTDPRLQGCGCLVFLSLKQKGRGAGHTRLTQDEFSTLINKALDAKVPVGFDSCSAHKFLAAVKDHPQQKQVESCVEPCEASCFSSYVNVDAEFFPCSFMENTYWKEGISVLGTAEFKDIWESSRNLAFRETLLFGGRQCPEFNI